MTAKDMPPITDVPSAYLDDIIKAPDDDGVRLIFADWLEDHGNEEGRARGEVIRVQVDPAKADASDRQRASQHLARYGKGWANPILGPGVRKVNFVRGFPQEVECTASAFLRHGNAWAAVTPLVALTLTGVAGRARQLADSAHLRHVKSLSILDTRFDDEDLVALAQSTNLPSLDSFSIAGGESGRWPTRVLDDGVEALASLPRLTDLTSLRLHSDGLLHSCSVDPLAAALAEKGKLTSLALVFTAIDDEGANALANSAGLKGVERLELSLGDIQAAGLVTLLTSPHLRALSDVDLHNNLITGDVLRTLVSADLPPNLKHLRLDSNQLGAVDVGAVQTLLARYPALKLSLLNCAIPRQTQEVLQRDFSRHVRTGFVPRQKRPNRISISW